MAKKNEKRAEQWVEAKRRCRLSAEQLRRAKKMGLNPVSLLKNIPASTQQWKKPVGDWVDGIYEKQQKEAARKKAKRAEATKFPSASNFKSAHAGKKLSTKMTRANQPDKRYSSAITSITASKWPLISRSVRKMTIRTC